MQFLNSKYRFAYQKYVGRVVLAEDFSNRLRIRAWLKLTAELGSLLIINSAFGQEILDFTNDLQDKFINQRKADKLNNLMQKLMFVWQKKV